MRHLWQMSGKQPDQQDAPIICMLALPDMSVATFFGLHEVFTTLGRVWVELTGDETFSAEFDVRVLAESGSSITCAGGAIVVPDATLSEVSFADVIIVPDLAIGPDMDCNNRWPEVSNWLRRMRANGAMICTACNGSVLLASAGLLDDCPATTHWGFVDHFRRFFPRVKLEPNRILVPATADGRIITAGGLSSWQDLALFIVARFHGEAAAIKAAKLFLFGDRSDGQLPYAAATKPNRHDDGVVARCQAWIAENYDVANPVARMAERSGLASRTFKRRFKTATGFAPLDYVQKMRVEEAKQMLETTDDPIDSIARNVGYVDPASFRRLFKRLTSVTPGRYRRRYRSLAEAAKAPGRNLTSAAH